MTSANETFASKHKWLGTSGAVLLIGSAVFHVMLWLGAAIQTTKTDDSSMTVYGQVYADDKSALQTFFDTIAGYYSQSITTLVVAPTVIVGALGLAMMVVAGNGSPRMLRCAGTISFVLGIVSLCGNLVAATQAFFSSADFDTVSAGSRVVAAASPALGASIAIAFVVAGRSLLATPSSDVERDATSNSEESAAQPAE